MIEKKLKVMLDSGAYVPERAHESDAGYDLRTPYEVYIFPKSFQIIDTGVHVALPKGYYGKLESKSGLMVNDCISCPGGVIDSGYTGSVRVKLVNHSNAGKVFQRGDKIVQMIIHKHEAPVIEIVDELEETVRGNNGFGSSGR